MQLKAQGALPQVALGLDKLQDTPAKPPARSPRAADLGEATHRAPASQNLQPQPF